MLRGRFPGGAMAKKQNIKKELISSLNEDREAVLRYLCHAAMARRLLEVQAIDFPTMAILRVVKERAF